MKNIAISKFWHSIDFTLGMHHYRKSTLLWYCGSIVVQFHLISNVSRVCACCLSVFYACSELYFVTLGIAYCITKPSWTSKVLYRPYAYGITEGRPPLLGVKPKRGTVTCAIAHAQPALAKPVSCHTITWHTLRTDWEPTLFEHSTCAQRDKSWTPTWRRCYGDCDRQCITLAYCITKPSWTFKVLYWSGFMNPSYHILSLHFICLTLPVIKSLQYVDIIWTSMYHTIPSLSTEWKSPACLKLSKHGASLIGYFLTL